jgi:hypothetical protein
LVRQNGRFENRVQQVITTALRFSAVRSNAQRIRTLTPPQTSLDLHRYHRQVLQDQRRWPTARRNSGTHVRLVDVLRSA